MVTEGGEERRKVAEDLDEEKIDENLSKVGKKTAIHVQEAQRIPIKINQRGSHQLLKKLKKKKKRNLESSRENKQLCIH